MDKVIIQEIAEEAGLSNGELIEKAKELGFNVKAANSTISMDDAGVLVDYAISGTLPKGFKKPGEKPKLKVVKKKVAEEETVAEKIQPEEVPAEKEPVVEIEAETEPEKEVESKTIEVEVEEKEAETVAAEEKTEESPAPEPVVPKEPKQRRGISVVSKKTDSGTADEAEEKSRNEEYFPEQASRSSEKQNLHRSGRLRGSPWETPPLQW